MHIEIDTGPAISASFLDLELSKLILELKVKFFDKVIFL
jgi:hypothetical protein